MSTRSLVPCSPAWNHVSPWTQPCQPCWPPMPPCRAPCWSITTWIWECLAAVSSCAFRIRICSFARATASAADSDPDGVLDRVPDDLGNPLDGLPVLHDQNHDSGHSDPDGKYGRAGQRQRGQRERDTDG